MTIELSGYLNQQFDDVPFLDRPEWVANAGVDACDFSTWGVEDWRAVADRAHELGLDIAYMTDAVTSMTDPDRQERSIAESEALIERAASVECPCLHLPVGDHQPDLAEATQRESIVAVLDSAAETAAAADVELVLEPRNDLDHPNFFLTTTEQAYGIVEDVGNSNLKVLFDVYHEQTMRGNLIRNIRANVEHIGHVHCADVPTRGEPGTGEVDFANVFEALATAGYDGYVGCEFRPTGEYTATMAKTRALLERAVA